MQTTIYRITNLDSGRTYIGQTTRALATRLYEHTAALKRGKHCNDQFQQDYNDGNTTLRIQKLAGSNGTKEQVKALEMKYARNEINPYNIRTGSPGDMNGRSFIKLRAEDYIDIAASVGRVKPQELIKRFQISAAMVSMIRSGVRTPQKVGSVVTSFVNVVSDFDTIVNEPTRVAA